MATSENKALACYLCARVDTKERREGVPVCKSCQEDHLISVDKSVKNDEPTIDLDFIPIDELDLGLGEDDPWADGAGWAPNFDRR